MEQVELSGHGNSGNDGQTQKTAETKVTVTQISDWERGLFKIKVLFTNKVMSQSVCVCVNRAASHSRISLRARVCAASLLISEA